ncbi:MAG: hypothetical protein BRC38_16125 [Cyanobacteria bacterium QH_6_48_35]|nr:MAG: hypothetical protein BRC38_16125 [Cyanobacteria bacterium QH_6_48_35]
MTGGPIGAFLAPGAFVLTSKNSSTRKSNWIKWVTVGIIDAPLSWAITGAMLPESETTQANSQAGSEVAEESQPQQQAEQTKELENRIAELEKQLEEKEAANSQASEKAKIEPSPSPEPSLKLLPSPSPEPEPKAQYSEDEKFSYLFFLNNMNSELGDIVNVDGRKEFWFSKGTKICQQIEDGTTANQQFSTLLQEKGSSLTNSKVLAEGAMPIVAAPQTLCSEYSAQSDQVIERMKNFEE